MLQLREQARFKKVPREYSTTKSKLLKMAKRATGKLDKLAKELKKVQADGVHAKDQEQAAHEAVELKQAELAELRSEAAEMKQVEQQLAQGKVSDQQQRAAQLQAKYEAQVEDALWAQVEDERDLLQRLNAEIKQQQQQDKEAARGAQDQGEGGGGDLGAGHRTRALLLVCA